MPPASSHLTVAVLLGGINSEREISLETGRRVMEALHRLGYEAAPVVYEGNLGDMVAALRGYDLVFNALHGGDGEDGTVQTALDKAGIAYTGSRPRASRLAMDKHASKQRMVAIGIPTTPWVSLMLADGPASSYNSTHPELRTFLEEHPYPVVVKPNHEGSTVGLSIVETRIDLEEALLLAREFGSQVLVESYVPGRELTVAILDQRPLPIVEIVPRHRSYDYECKYTDGMSAYFVPADLPLDVTVAIQEEARRLYEDLGCRHYARADFRFNPEGRFFCLELNTLPGMTSHSLVPMAARAAGISFDKLIDSIIRLALSDSRSE
ncbi:MAG: D-alanine--D-alanine ligase [Candidatus Neomarinimicrobiota bacterium]